MTGMSHCRESPTDWVSCDVGYPKFWNSHTSRFLHNSGCPPACDVLQALIGDALSSVAEACLLLGSRSWKEQDRKQQKRTRCCGCGYEDTTLQPVAEPSRGLGSANGHSTPSPRLTPPWAQAASQTFERSLTLSQLKLLSKIKRESVPSCPDNPQPEREPES